MTAPLRQVVCHRFGPLQDLAIEAVPPRAPGVSQVLVSMRAAGINYPEALIVQGLHHFKPGLPYTPGGELAGVVKAVGPGVEAFEVGQSVFASRLHGAFADEVVVDIDNLQPMPPGMSFEQTAGLSTTYNTSYYALVILARVRAGDTVLVLGAAGGVGLAAVEIAKAYGARVIAAASTEVKLQVCAEHGADTLINYERDNLRERLRQVAPDGVDVVYDPVGGPFAEQAMRALAWGGRYLVVGFAAGEIPRMPLNLVLMKGAQVLGVLLGEIWTRDRALVREIDAGMMALVRAGRIKPRVCGVYPLARAADALQAMVDRQAVGKLVLVP